MRAALRPLYTSASGIAAALLLLMFVVLAIVAPPLWQDRAEAVDVTNAWQPPSAEAPLGTDELGRDVMARTLVATRLSLLSAMSASALAIGIGLPLGLLASAFGSRTTRVFQSVIGISIAFPALLTAMFVGTIVGIGIPGAVLGIGIAMAPIFARLAQTLTASVTRLDYVAAARTMGVPTRLVLTRHILPNVAEPLIISGTTSVGISILAISALSFLGLGSRPPTFDWGGLLETGLRAIYFAPLHAAGPGVMIALAGIAFSLLGEAFAGSVADAQSTGRMARLGRRMAAASRRETRARQHAAPADGPDRDRLLEVTNLVVQFPGADHVVTPVRGVDLNLGVGERAGIVGESGSGKSLTAMAIAQLIDYPGVVTSDRLWFDGQELSSLSMSQLKTFLGTKLAMVFQNPMSSLNPAIRIGNQVSESSRVHRRLTKAEGRVLAVETLTQVGIEDAEVRLRQYPHEFSGGMQQRVMIAMGLTESPQLIIADEPTTALDVTIQRQILDLLEEVNVQHDTAILLISHDIAVITSICDRVIVMYGGLVMEDLPTNRLLSEAAHPYTRALIDAVPDLETSREHDLATIPGMPPSPSEAIGGCAFAQRCPAATDICHEQRPALELIEIGHSAACWHPQRSSTLAARDHAHEDPNGGKRVAVE